MPDSETTASQDSEDLQWYHIITYAACWVLCFPCLRAYEAVDDYQSQQEARKGAGYPPSSKPGDTLGDRFHNHVRCRWQRFQRDHAMERPPQKLPLPQEIVDLIIDLSQDDKPMLRACSLVCASWVSRTRMYLFPTLSIQREAGYQLVRLLQSPYCTFAACMKRLRLQDAVLWKKYTFPILEALEKAQIRLESLHLELLYPPTASSTVRLTSFQLSHLHVTCVDPKITMSLLAHMISSVLQLQTLVVDFKGWYSLAHPDFPAEATLQIPTTLREVTICSTQPRLNAQRVLIAWVLKHARLTALQCFFTLRDEDRAMIVSFMESQHAQLEHLGLSIPFVTDCDFSLWFKTLPALSTVRSLTLSSHPPTFSIGGVEGYEETLKSMLRNLLCSCENIKEIYVLNDFRSKWHLPSNLAIIEKQFKETSTLPILGPTDLMGGLVKCFRCAGVGESDNVPCSIFWT